MHPILFRLGPFTIYSYGVCVALAMLAAFFYTRKNREAQDLLFLLFLSGLAGARLFFVAQHPGDYRLHPWRVFWIQEGGLVWYGGFLTAVAVGALAVRARKGSVLKWADYFSPILALGQGIGRVGCFLNGCCYGKLTGAGTRYPTQLYEMSLLFALAIFLLLGSFKKHRDGQVFAAYLGGYGAIRFLVEFLRGDQELFGMFTLPQWISLVLIFAAFFLNRFSKRKIV
ncbi:MAG: prolipoprotein diacylglyceryl transferase [Candidatus Omnitrophica bacterium]|nr:prolipoprotein diacylglyceryl transferase [Candidatus Omnitrophota bacterium]